MKSIFRICAISTLIMSNVVAANTMDFNVNIGLAISQLSNNSAVSPVAGLTKSYEANEGVQHGPFVGLGFEYDFTRVADLPITLGLGLTFDYVDLGKVAGIETPGSNLGLTDTLDYQMQADSTVLLFEPRLIYTDALVQPYLLAGIGYARNTLSNYIETVPDGSNAAPGNPYADHTEGSFAYEFGGGVQCQLDQMQDSRLMFRLEYRYLNLGNAELGVASGQTTGERLASKNMHTNIVSFGLSYQFK